jgi:type IV fimbrial biogenesis protein FimT
MLATVSVIAILGVIAAPGMQGLVIDGRVSSASIALRSSIELARSEAMSAGRRAGLCRSADPSAGVPACSDAVVDGRGATDWGSGWIVYVKGDPDNGDGFAPGDRLIRRFGPFGIAPSASRVSIWAPVQGPLLFEWTGIRNVGPVGTFAFDFGPPTTVRPTTLSWRSPACLQVNPVGRIDVRPHVNGVCT